MSNDRENTKPKGKGRAARDALYRANGWWGQDDLVVRYQRIVQTWPHKDILSDDRGRRLTNGGLWAAAETMRRAFEGRGIEPGDVVIVILPNWVEWQVVHLAIRMLGAIPANIPLKTDAKMLSHVVELVSARCLVGTHVFDGFDVGAVLNEAAGNARHKVDILKIDQNGARDWSTNNSATAPTRPDDPRLDHIMFTSSTTGMPKAVMHSKDSLNAFHETIASRFDLTNDGSIFMGSPLGHSVGAIHGARMSLYFGLPLVLQQRWDAAGALRLIEENSCTFTAAATPFLKDLIDLKADTTTPKLNSMRHFLCGGAQVPPALLERAEKEFPNTFVTVLWGMTEGGYTTCIPGHSPREKCLFTAGCASDGLEIVITDDAGNPVAPDTEGDLIVRGPALFHGYYNQPELTKSLFDDEGFFFVGDRAVMDCDGYIRITGRSKDLIIRGGVNISPVPIEDTLAAHPGVSSVAVVGFPDERLGERICAVFGPSPTRLSHDQVIRFAAENGLAKQHWPERVMHIEKMPMTPAGKIRKNDVRKWLADQIAASGAQE